MAGDCRPRLLVLNIRDRCLISVTMKASTAKESVHTLFSRYII